MAKGQKLGDLFFTVSLNDKDLDASLKKASSGLKTKGTSAGKTFGTGFGGGIKKTLGSLNLGGMLGLAGLGLLVTSSINTFKKFEKTMSEVKAVSGATAKEMASLTGEAKRLGSSTEFTATQAGEGLIFLSRAGLSAKEQLEAIGPALDFATANNIELAKSADIATNIMGQFGKNVKDLPGIMNVLSKTTATSNTSILQLAEAMKYAGPTANALGIPIEEMSASIGILGNSGLQGSLATRALGTSLTRLAKPTTQMQGAIDKLGLSLFDSEGSFVGINELIGQLETGMDGYTDKQKQAALSTLFGAEAIQEMNILLDAGSDTLKTYTQSLADSTGQTEKMAAVMRDNLQGSIDGMKSAREGLQIQMTETGTKSGWLRDVFDTLAGGLRFLTGKVKDIGFGETNEELKRLGINAEISSEGLDKLKTEFGANSQAIAIQASEYAKLKREVEGGVISYDDFKKKSIEVLDISSKLKDQQDKLIGTIKKIIRVEGERERVENEIIKVSEDGTLSMQEKNEANKKNILTLQNLDKAENDIIRVQEILTGSTTNLTDVLTELSTAKTQSEFQNLRTEKLKQIDTDLLLIRSQLALQQAYVGTDKFNRDFVVNLGKASKSLIGIKGEIKKTTFAPKADITSITNGNKTIDESNKSVADKQKEYIKEQEKALTESFFLKKQQILINENDEKISQEAIKQLTADTEIAKLELQGKTGEAQIKRLEQERDMRSNISDLYGNQEADIQSAIDDTKDKIDEYTDKIAEIEDAYREMGESAKQELYGINKALLDSQNDLTGDLTKQYVKLQGELKSLQGKEEKTPEDQAKIQTLKQEMSLIEANTTAEERKKAIAEEALSDSEKLLVQYSKEKQALLEKKAILEAIQIASQTGDISSQFEVRETEDGTQEAYQVDEEGKMQLITDEKNAQYVIDTLNKATELEKQKLEFQMKLDEEMVSEKAQQEKIKQLLLAKQSFIEGMAIKEGLVADKLYEKRLKVYNMMKKAGGGGGVTSRASGGPLSAGQTSFVSEEGLELWKSGNSMSLLSPGLFTPTESGQVYNANQTKNIVNKSINLGGLNISGENTTGMTEDQFRGLLDRYMEEQIGGIDFNRF